MNEKRRKTIVFAALGLAVVWAWFNIGSDKPDVAKYELTTIQSVGPSGVVDSAKTAVEIDTARLLSLPWGSDPLRPMATVKRRVAPTLSWKLTGIMFSSSEPMAYVNKKVVRVGDMIDNAKVIKIDRQSVTLKYSNELIKLTVSKV